MSWAHRTTAQERAIVGLSGRHTQHEIAALVGVSAWTVFDVQRKYHVVQRFGRHHAAGRRYAWDEQAWGRVLEELYVRQRLSIGDVADRCGVHRGTIRRRLDALGFRIRATGEQNAGTHRGRYRLALPDCATPGCPTRVRTPGETLCAACRRREVRAA